jgi:hypothetical protein
MVTGMTYANVTVAKLPLASRKKKGQVETVIISMDTEEVKFSKMCTVTGEIYCIIVDKDRYAQWNAGACVQDVWPSLSKGAREFVVSGTTPSEWTYMYGECEVEDE